MQQQSVVKFVSFAIWTNLAGMLISLGFHTAGLTKCLVRFFWGLGRIRTAFLDIQFEYTLFELWFNIFV